MKTARMELRISLAHAAKLAVLGIGLSGLREYFSKLFVAKGTPPLQELEQTFVCFTPALLVLYQALDVWAEALTKWRYDVADITADITWSKISESQRRWSLRNDSKWQQDATKTARIDLECGLASAAETAVIGVD